MKKLLITGLIALGALVFAPAKAHAQTITFDVPVSRDSHNQPVAGASGTYHTVITYLGSNNYQVVVTGNNDGNAPTNTAGNPGPIGGPIAKSGIGTLSFNFASTLGGDIVATATSGITTAWSGSPSNLGGPNNVPFGATGGAWAINNGLTLRFTAPDEPAYIAPRGGNTFTGLFSLAQPFSNLASIHASYQDSGQQWTTDAQVVPEPATAAMALPGLLPMAPLALMALRRRRKATSDVEAEEAEA